MLEQVPSWAWFLIGTGIAAGLSYAIVKLPASRAWVKTEVVKAYNFLDQHKEVPEELKPTWQAAYDECDAIIDALGDEKITLPELLHMTKHMLEIVGSIRKLCGV
jgi:hypothetical protein